VNDKLFWKCTNTILSLITKCPDKYSATQHLFVCLFYFVADGKKLIEENKQNDGGGGAMAQ